MQTVENFFFAVVGEARQQKLYTKHQQRGKNVNFIKKIMLTISDDILDNAGISAHELLQEIAIYLYAKKKLSFGQAKKLSGLNVLQFQELLYNNNVPNHYGITELEEDFKSIQNFKRK